ncbi:MAG: hypothetical protein LC122_14100 [Chitinophagales bacterium]|nr:hypothetical protein [Chitinophagales bacterium]
MKKFIGKALISIGEKLIAAGLLVAAIVGLFINKIIEMIFGHTNGQDGVAGAFSILLFGSIVTAPIFIPLVVSGTVIGKLGSFISGEEFLDGIFK